MILHLGFAWTGLTQIGYANKKELRLRLWNITVPNTSYKKLFQSKNHLKGKLICKPMSPLPRSSFESFEMKNGNIFIKQFIKTTLDPKLCRKDMLRNLVISVDELLLYDEYCLPLDK